MGREIFNTRSIDEDTRILSTEYLNQDGYDLLIEIWLFDGIKGQSLIFVSPQIATLSEDDIREYSFKFLDLPEQSKWTLKRKQDFTYFNFGFKV